MSQGFCVQKYCKGEQEHEKQLKDMEKRFIIIVLISMFLCAANEYDTT